ncbi:DUF1189 family protein [Vagococcus entomophilus]|uniref:DUF1189 domain-containing protein n=1 Tax=Vagococcus entomophilus TaxID=1160095 RepID=A0A430AEP6_9ENTE|nr:DUF1189 family protein [Vagococcus entomophilus]RSU05901.1 hypothetical protein CBF30_11345 [Vagococcus entomophilus]
MHFYQFLHTTFKNPRKLLLIKNKSGWKVFLYLIFISFIASFPLLFQSYSVLQEVAKDGASIAKSVPEFSIQNGVLSSKEDMKSFIYQTNSIIFTFDPEGKRTDESVQKDLIGTTLGIAFLKDHLVIATATDQTLGGLLPKNPFSIRYTHSELQTMNGQLLKNLFTFPQKSTMLKGFIFFVCLIPTFLSLAFEFFIFTLFLTSFSKFRGLNFTTGDTFKLLVICSFYPAVLSTLLNFLIPNFPGSILLMLMTLWLYFLSTKKVSS